MKKHSLLISAAAVAMVTGAGFAFAQSPKGAEGASPAPPAQQNAPAEKTAPAVKPGNHADQKGSPGASQGVAKPGATAQTKGTDTKTEHNGAAKADNNAGAKGERKADSKNADSKNADSKADTKNGSDNAAAESKSNDRKESASDKTGNDRSKTTGQGAAGAKGAVNLTPEKRTQIRTTIRERVHFEPIKNVNFSISIGSRVPRTVHFYSVPTEVVEIYPQWRGYKVIEVRDEILIIDPESYEIVYVIT